MEWWIWVVVAFIVLVIAAVIVAAVREERTEALRERFGMEYDRTLADRGGRRDGEAELRDRLDRREEMDVRPLSPDAARRFTDEWHDVQARFVDAPGDALADADALLTDVMRVRGYPVKDFSQQSEDMSVDHGDVVEDYRDAHEISMANAGGHATTEELRQAMVEYRSLFVRLVAAGDGYR